MRMRALQVLLADIAEQVKDARARGDSRENHLIGDGILRKYGLSTVDVSQACNLLHRHTSRLRAQRTLNGEQRRALPKDFT